MIYLFGIYIVKVIKGEGFVGAKDNLGFARNDGGADST